MTDPEDKKMRELAWRRQPTAAESAEMEAFLATHPGEREDWDLEIELNRVLEQFPSAPPVASNFTAQVLQAVERERNREARRRIWPRWLTGGGWLPRLATAAVAIALTGTVYLQHQAHARVTMARDVARITEIVSAADPMVMEKENFEAIRRMSAQPEADPELLALKL